MPNMNLLAQAYLQPTPQLKLQPCIESYEGRNLKKLSWQDVCLYANVNSLLGGWNKWLILQYDPVFLSEMKAK